MEYVQFSMFPYFFLADEQMVAPLIRNSCESCHVLLDLLKLRIWTLGTAHLGRPATIVERVETPSKPGDGSGAYLPLSKSNKNLVELTLEVGWIQYDTEPVGWWLLLGNSASRSFSPPTGSSSTCRQASRPIARASNTMNSTDRPMACLRRRRSCFSHSISSGVEGFSWIFSSSSLNVMLDLLKWAPFFRYSWRPGTVKVL